MAAAELSRPFRFSEALLFHLILPKGIVAAISAAGAYIAIAESPWQRVLILSGVFFLVGTLACTTWAIAGNTLSHYLSTGRSATWMNAAMGVLILGTAALILFG